jgi:putative ABC transport system substrate-binding protein
MGSDPVAEGFVESLSRPGGNMTGITSMAGSLAPKRLELTREFLRDDAPTGILINPANPLSGAERRDAEAASRSIGQHLEVFTASNQAEIEQAFAAIKERQDQCPNHRCRYFLLHANAADGDACCPSSHTGYRALA